MGIDQWESGSILCGFHASVSTLQQSCCSCHLTLTRRKQDIVNFLTNTRQQLINLYNYKPDSSCVFQPNMTETDKLERLWLHSEKLALAWALMSLSTSENIVMHKNLRVCKDCHEALKLIAMLHKRTFVIRDAIRFHHFENGKCSCNDFW